MARLVAAALLSFTLVGVPLSAETATAAEPTFTQPADVTALPGATATFSVSGLPASTYVQWFRVGTASAVASGFVTGVSSYTTKTLTDADDGAQFYAKVLLGGSFVTTQTVTLTVGTGELRFKADPQDVTVLEGRPASFTTSVAGTSPFTYQWETSADDGASWQDVPSATGSTLALRPSLDKDGNLYRVVVDNPVSDPTPSKAAHLNVRALSGNEVPVTDAAFVWGINRIYQGGNPAGNGCNNFSAGTQLEFAAAQGDVRIVHETSDGLVSVSDGTKCVDQSTTGMQQRVLLTHGTGTANAETGEATIQWQGGFLANAYGGLVPWWLKDLKLTVEPDGTGTLTAIGGGYGSDMDNPNEMHPIAERPVTVATFQDVSIDEDGITVQPDYAGVEITVPEGVSAEPQLRTGAGWGGWPQSFVDLHFDTALSSYWYSSGLSADPDKPPFPFSVTFENAPAVRELPSITTSPVLSGALPLLNGRTATVSATVDGATTIAWERATNPTNGPWTVVDGATSQTLTIDPVSAAWNNQYVRVVATNAAGTARSAGVRITTKDYVAPSFTRQPTAVTAFDGHRATFTAKADAYPAPLADSQRVQISLDGGATWKDVPDAIRAAGSSVDTFVIPSVSSAQDGALVRVTASTAEGEVAGSPGLTVVSDAVPLTVLPSKSGPQVAVVASSPIDPTKATTLTVIGAGFVFPAPPADPNKSYSLDLGLFDADVWQPGQTGVRDWVATSPSTSGGSIYRAPLDAAGGTFTVTVNVPAGKLDPTKVYGIGTFSRLTDSSVWVDTFDDRTSDAWTPVLVAGQSAAQITAQPADVELPHEGGTAHLEVGVSGSPTPTVTWERRDAGSTRWDVVDGATAASLDVPATATDDGAAFRAVVTNRLAAAQTSREATVTLLPGVLAGATPTLSATPKVGVAVTAVPGEWTAGAELTYQWLRDGQTIPGATRVTYTPAAADSGTGLSVRVTGALAGYSDLARTSDAAKVAAGTLSGTTPTLSATPKVGTKVTAKPGTWTSGTRLAYQWLRDGRVIPGATATTYTPVAADSGKVLSVRVTGTLAGFADLAKTSASTKVTAGTLSATTPTISGKAKVGTRLTAKPGTWTSGTTLTYQWYVGGKAVKGATGKTYTPAGSTRGKTVTVKVKGAKTGYTTVTKTSKATAKVAAGTLKAATPKVSGKAKVGTRLTAKAGTWTSGTRLTYQWYVGGKAVKGATSKTFTPKSAHGGKTVTLKVKGTKTGYTTVTKTSKATAKVAR